MSIYVEIRIRGPLEELWKLTQTPELHEQWDLRFTRIEYLPRPDESAPQRFRYATRIGFGMEIRGEGESVGARNDADGSRTSALKFWSNDSKSLIREGAGYWQYLPTDDGVRFLTSYDYRVRFGAAGRAVDAAVFRPLMRWATAWSFDRLRLWIEKGISPAISLRTAAIHALATLALAFVWIYQGVIPKLWFAHTSEAAMLADAGVPLQLVPRALKVVGVGEIALGAMTLWFTRTKWPYLITILLMVAASAAVAVNSPTRLTAAFNPVSLNALMLVMAFIGLLTYRDAPSSRNCLRRPPEEST